MAPMERTEGNPDRKASQTPEIPGYEIHIAPFKRDGVTFDQLPDGRPVMKFQGEMQIFPADKPKSPSTVPFPEVFEAVRRDPRLSQAEQTVHKEGAKTSEPRESAVRDDKSESGSGIPDATPTPHSGDYSTGNKASKSPPPSERQGLPEDENRKYELVGNVVYDAKYRVRKSGKRIADFVLAEHPDKNTTQYYRVRAFNDLAERVRDTVRMGQKDVAATVYGPKHWHGRKKTKDGYEETTVTGYYAGFVKVPKRYQEDKSPAAKDAQPVSQEEHPPSHDAQQPTHEEVRELRQEKLDQNIERMRERAARLEETAEGKQAEFNDLRGDIAFLTQPASPDSAFGKQRNRITDRYDKGAQLHAQAQDLMEKADRLEKRGALVKGDTERARQLQREAMDKVVEKGTQIHDFAFGKGEVVRINKKTYTIVFASGFKTTRDKSYVRLPEQKEAEKQD